jgi:MFS family permease
LGGAWKAVEVPFAAAAWLLHREYGFNCRSDSPTIHRVAFQCVPSSRNEILIVNHTADALNQLSWIGTAFTLTDTAFVPIFGQLADVFGRYAALQIAVVIMTVGGILCASASVWPVLVLGRAIQGVGTAGMSTCSLIILADKVSLKEQAFNTSIFHFLIGVAYATGPLVRAFSTEMTHTDNIDRLEAI